MRRLKIAVPGPQSGPRAAYGELIRQAINDLGHLPPLEIQWFDDQADPVVAVRVASMIAEDNGFGAVAGHFNSDCARAAIPIYRAARVPLLLPASTAIGLADGQDVFRLCADESRQAAAIIAFWQSHLKPQGQPLHLWSDGSAYAKRLSNQLKLALKGGLPAAPPPHDAEAAKGITIVYCGTHVAVLERFAQEGADWPAAAICCDDCFVEEFELQSRQGTWVCAPHADYGRLLQDAIETAYRILVLKTARWLDMFDAHGEHRLASWRMHQIASRSKPVLIQLANN